MNWKIFPVLCFKSGDNIVFWVFFKDYWAIRKKAVTHVYCSKWDEKLTVFKWKKSMFISKNRCPK